MRFGLESSTIRKRRSKRTERLAKLAPSDTQILFDLARLYEAKGDLDRARDTFKRVLDLDPKYVAALIAIGQVEIRRRDSTRRSITSIRHTAQQFRLGMSLRRVRRCTR